MIHEPPSSSLQRITWWFLSSPCLHTPLEISCMCHTCRFGWSMFVLADRVLFVRPSLGHTDRTVLTTHLRLLTTRDCASSWFQICVTTSFFTSVHDQKPHNTQAIFPHIPSNFQTEVRSQVVFTAQISSCLTLPM